MAHKGGGKHLNYHPNEEIHLRPWQASDLAAVAPVVAAAHAGALSGLLLTTPAAPTAAGLERFVSGLLAGESGAFLPDFSFIAELNGRSVGLVLAIRDAEGQPTLLELATHPSVQGRGVGRRLVIAMQQALLAAGETRMVFITTGDNSPVHRLFTPDEILSRSEARGGYWLEG